MVDSQSGTQDLSR